MRLLSLLLALCTLLPLSLTQAHPQIQAQVQAHWTVNVTSPTPGPWEARVQLNCTTPCTFELVELNEVFTGKVIWTTHQPGSYTIPLAVERQLFLYRYKGGDAVVTFTIPSPPLPPPSLVYPNLCILYTLTTIVFAYKASRVKIPISLTQRALEASGIFLVSAVTIAATITTVG